MKNNICDIVYVFDRMVFFLYFLPPAKYFQKLYYMWNILIAHMFSIYYDIYQCLVYCILYPNNQHIFSLIFHHFSFLFSRLFFFFCFLSRFTFALIWFLLFLTLSSWTQKMLSSIKNIQWENNRKRKYIMTGHKMKLKT